MVIDSNREYRPIADYGIIGDMHSCALIASDASIDWCCLPDFDSPSIFGAILDRRKGGRFQIAPTSEYESRREYLKDTNILKTLFKTSQGSIELIDFMPSYSENDRCISFGEIHRRITCIDGRESVRIHFDPKLDYGRSTTTLDLSKHGCNASDKDYALSLSTRIPLHVDGFARGELLMSKGESETLVLRYGTGEARPPEEYESAKKLGQTRQFWEEWVSKTNYNGLWRDQVIRSSLLLKLLVYDPTGGLIAAPTTSLPETIGGSRNWDYRFSWLRDAAFALWAFKILGHKYEADAYFRWLIRAGYADYGAELRLMFGIKGDEGLREEELHHLEGYRGSRPVRIGNGAFDQFQLDVYGAVLDSIYFYHTHGERLQPEKWKIVEDLVDFVHRNWEKPDHGIWEVREEKRHYVYSKVMSWVALDRGVHLAQEMGFPKNAKTWKSIGDRIREEILTRGWSDKKRAFVQHYDSDVLDSSVLIMPLVKFLPATDQKFISTVDKIRDELASDHLVYRYRVDDGLEGKEGAFALCSFWLVDAYTLSGRVDEARRLFEKLLKHGNNLGLYSEQIDVDTGELLGNFPQAFTHMVLISSALNLNNALESKA